LLTLLCVGALLWSLPAQAQEQSGSIQGIVKDASGGVLPGATVEAKRAGGTGASTAVTDAEGRYRFPALPPGSYTITATLQGFQAGKVENANIALGQLLTINLTLAVGGVAESVQVTGESPLIDTKQSAAFATVSQETIERIPKGRDFTDVIKVAPGANEESRTGGIQVDGASGSENRFIIDGMDTTNIRTGVSGKTMLIDFVQEVQVKSSGYNAEFGGSTGGVISAITKSGSNSFRGSAGIYAQSYFGAGSLDDRPVRGYSPWTNSVTRTAVPQEGLINAQTPWNYYSPVGDIGGPIMKDKMWFYGGIAYTKNQYNQDVRFIAEPGHPLRSFDWYSWSYYPNYNVTWQLSNAMRVRVTGSNQRNKSRGAGTTLQPVNRVFDGIPGTTSCSSLAWQDMVGKRLEGYTNNSTSWLSSVSSGCTFNQTSFDNIYKNTGSDSRNDVIAGNLDWVIKPTFFVNTTAGYYRTNAWTDPSWRIDSIRRIYSTGNLDSNMLDPQYTQVNGQPWPLVPSTYQNVSGWADQTKTSYGTDRDTYTRIYVNLNTTWFKSAKGQHVVKAGVRYERFGNDVLNGYTQPVVNVYWGRTFTPSGGGVAQQGTYGYYMVSQQGTVGNVHSDNYSFWVQDSWSVNSKLTVNAGVRAENEFIPSYKTAPDAYSISFGFGDKIAPRLGFAYDVKGDGKWKLYGSFGYFYDITKLELPRGSFGGDHWVQYYWSLDTADVSTINCGEGTTGCPGRFLGQWDARLASNQTSADGTKELSAYFGKPFQSGIDPNLKPVQTGEAVFGLDHELNATMSLSLRYVHKWLGRTIEDVGILTDAGEPYMIANPGYGYASTGLNKYYPQYDMPAAQRDYDSVEVRLRKRFARAWSAEVDYTYSRLYGNYSGLANTDENARTAPNVTRSFDNVFQVYNDSQQLVYGLLQTDRPHVLKLQGTYDFKWGTSVGAYALLQSGAPNQTSVGWTSTSGYPIFAFGRGDLGRLPYQKMIDLNIQQDFRLGKNKRISLAANIMNVFDIHGYTSVYTVNPYRSSLSPANPDSAFFGAPWTPAQIAGQMRAAGTSILDSDFYNKLEGRQGRREMRFQAKFSF